MNYIININYMMIYRNNQYIKAVERRANEQK